MLCDKVCASFCGKSVPEKIPKFNSDREKRLLVLLILKKMKNI